MVKRIIGVLLTVAVTVATFQFVATDASDYGMGNVVSEQNGKINKESMISANAMKKTLSEAKKYMLDDSETEMIKEAAKNNGEEAAAKVNSYDNENFEAAVTTALTYYYENNDFKEYGKFVENVDAKADRFVENFKKAAEERKDAAKKNYEVGTVIAEFNKETTDKEINELANVEYGKCLEIANLSDGSKLARFEISLGQTVDMATAEYKEYEATNTAEPNWFRTASEVPDVALNDPDLVCQYYLDNINIYPAWNCVHSMEHSKVTVAVIDTGVDYRHSELKSIMSPYSADITGDSPVLFTDCASTYTTYHGTAVAGCVAAKSNNGVGFAGVASAYDNDVVEILGVQASTYFSDYGEYRFSMYNEAKAIDYSIEKGAKVINMSLSGEGYSDIEYDAIERAKQAGITVVVSAGNSAGDEYRHPSDYENVISVVATDRNNNITDFSSFGMAKDVAAPGYGIYTTSLSNGYTFTDGTSFSSPITAGVVAMMYSVNPAMNFEKAYNALTTTTVDIGLGNKCSHGLINAGEAVKAAAAMNCEMPTTKSVNILEVIGMLVSSSKNNTVNVVWGQDGERIESGCRYNVYVNDVLYLENVICNAYEIGNISAGRVAVRVTATKDGAETEGVTQYVSVEGQTFEMESGIENPPETTKENSIEITTEDITTENPIEITTETITTENPPEVTTEIITTENPTEEETTFNYMRLNGTSNVAAGKTVTASVNQNDAKHLVNGNEYDFWVAPSNSNAEFSIDLDAVHRLSVLEINLLNKESSLDFYVEACNNGFAWRRIKTVNAKSTNRVLVDLDDVTYRYIKVQFYDNASHILSQVRVWGTRNSGWLHPVEVTCSGVENNQYLAEYAFDGNGVTRWSSAWEDRQWIKADFGEMKHIESVEIDWEAAYCSEYTVYFSENGRDWAAVVYGFKGHGGTDIHNVAWNARYMMIGCTTRATVYGSSIYEVRVKGF